MRQFRDASRPVSVEDFSFQEQRTKDQTAIATATSFRFGGAPLSTESFRRCVFGASQGSQKAPNAPKTKETRTAAEWINGRGCDGAKKSAVGMSPAESQDSEFELFFLSCLVSKRLKRDFVTSEVTSRGLDSGTVGTLIRIP